MKHARNLPGRSVHIFFIDAQTGWYGNGAGKIYKTTDGGFVVYAIGGDAQELAVPGSGIVAR